MIEKLSFKSHDAASIVRLINILGFPCDLERKDGAKGGFEFHFKFATGRGSICAPLEAKRSDSDSVEVALRIELNPYIVSPKVAGIPVGFEIKEIDMVPPSSFPAYKKDSMVRVDIADLPHFEKHCMHDIRCEGFYSLHSVTSWWIEARFQNEHIHEFGQYVLIPNGSEAFVLFMGETERPGKMVLSLYTFLS